MAETRGSRGAAPSVANLLADQRRRSLAGESFHADVYLDRYPSLRADPEGLLDLIYNEVVLREGLGDAPELSEFQARFPDLAGPLADLFEVHRAIGPAGEGSGTGSTANSPAPPSLSPRSEASDDGWPVLEGYQVVGVLGGGGMGVVYRARDLRRGVTVAVKTMRQVDAASIYRFKQEFRALLDVSHPNLVTLHELISDGRSWFIVMEYIDGDTLLDYVRGPSVPARPPSAAGADSAGGESTWSSDDAPRPSTSGPGPASTLYEELPSDVEPPPAPPSQPSEAAVGLNEAGRVRLRRCLRQLAEGLAALHRAGKLHRDIKPSNVMVARDGRVVLMDFGLISSREGDNQSTEGNVVGTAAYMAPEQAAGLRLSPASDWYSVGVVIYEALSGRRPFLGGTLQVLMDKQKFEPPPLRELVPDAPDDLSALCVDLLRRDPRARPSGDVVLSRLGAAAGPAGEGGSSTSHSGDLPFVGRTAQRAALADAFDDVRDGRTVVVFVHGPSGVGKSALVQRFLDDPAVRDGAVVLAGRCYECESVPYKALDSLIDALSRYLRRLPPHEAAALLPRDVAPLARVFPVLRRVEAVAAAPRRAAESPDPQELRRRAYAGLRELLARLGDRKPLVLAIDDLQWGDSDSMAVLTEILRPPDPPVLLLVASYRSEEAADNPFLRAALDAPEVAGLDRRELAVGPLSPEEAGALARQLLGGAVAGAERRAEVIAGESGGNPFFVAELVRSLHAGGADAGQGVEAEGEARDPIALDEVLWSRVLRLPDDARRLLEVVAVSGRPVRTGVAWQSLNRPGDERATLALLRSARLVRGASATSASDGDRVETYHDRVRETVVAHLAPDELVDCHRRLARAFEASGRADPEILGVHLQGAGETERAGEQFALAAAQAAETLAFERASALYRLALDLLPADFAGRRALRAALGEALANAGRGAEAARAYLAACEGETVAGALELRRKAAMQFLISGHIDQGLDALRDVLRAVGMTLPRTPRQALMSLLYHRARLWLRGVLFRPRDTSQVSAADLTRIDVCWSAGLGLSNVDWIRGADFQSRGLLLALRAGEPYRVARALTVEAAQSSTAGRSTHKQTARLLDTAEALTRGSDQPYAQGMLTLARGVSSYLESRWADALEACDRAEGVFRDRCTGVAWELDTAHAYALWALSHLGRWGELARRFPVLINEARERGDLYAAMNLSTYILSIVRLAADEPDAARAEIDRMAGRWSREGYHVQHNDRVWASVQIDLYLGDGLAAWARICGHWPTLARSLLLRVQFIRVAMWGLRARCALAAATSAPGPPDPYLRSASRDASRLEREKLPWADAQAQAVRAGLAALRGRRDESIDRLRRTSELFRSCDMSLCAAASDRRLGEALGGADGRALVDRSDALMLSESIRRPDRVADLFAPGFPSVGRP